MRTLFCDYFVPKSLPISTGEYWGVLSITNHNNVDQIVVISVMEYTTGKELKKKTVTIPARQSILFDNNDSNKAELLKGIVGKTRLYLVCSEFVTATVGNCKGTNSAISWERMLELPFPKYLP